MKTSNTPAEFKTQKLCPIGNLQIFKSSNLQIIKSSNHQIFKSSNNPPPPPNIHRAKHIAILLFYILICAPLFLKAQNNETAVFVTTYAGTGNFGFTDGNALTEATFFFPNKVGACLDTAGNLYVTDGGNHAIRKITPQGVVTTLAGNGTPGFADGVGMAAMFNSPSGLDADKTGNIYVADAFNNAIRKITPDGIVTTIANGTQFATPSDLAIDNMGNIFVTGKDNHKIQKISVDGIVSTIAGSTEGYADGAALQAQFSRPGGIALDKLGNIYVTDDFNHRIRKIDTDGIVTTVAGSSLVGSSGGYVDGNALTEAQFAFPSGLIIDEAGSIFVADHLNHRIRKISTNGIVSTFAGSGSTDPNEGSHLDGPGDAARFNRPSDICHNGKGVFFVADMLNHRIRKIELLKQFVTIEGTVFVDKDTSCTLTNIDTGIGNRMIEFEHSTGKYYVFSASIGNYQFTGPPGSYNVRLINTPVTTETCVSKVYNINLADGQSIAAQNFFILPDCKIDLFETTNFPFPLINPCPGLPIEYCFTVTNIGGLPIFPPCAAAQCLQPFCIGCGDPFLFFTYDADDIVAPITVSITGSNCGLSFTGSNTVSFPFGTVLNIFVSGILSVNDICDICVQAVVDPTIPITFPPVEILNKSAGVTGRCIDPTAPLGVIGVADKIFPFSDFVTCSSDPNDKLLTDPNGCGTGNKIKKNIPLTYLVRFQNTGNAPAFRVVIRDTLDPDFDITTLELAGTSHNISKFEVLPPNVLVWTFDNINLPDSFTNSEGSKGFVRFRIKHLPDLVDGTQLINKAAIFFDLNEPVITNTTLHTLFNEVGPLAAFNFERQCAANAFDFFYTGTSQNISVLWDFGEGSTPVNSISLNPKGIVFDTPGDKEIILSAFDSEGCSSFIIDTIEVADLSCGAGKVMVCHVPKGNPANKKTLCIDSVSLANHILHEDCVGPCFANNSTNKKPELLFEDIQENLSDNTFFYPNPFYDDLQIILPHKYKTIHDINIYNSLGIKVWSKSNLQLINGNDGVLISIEQLSSGIYYCVLHIDNEVLIRKLAKL